MSLLQVRIDKDLKEKAIQIANESNIDISIVVRLFLLMVIQEKAIPFSINSDNEYEKYRDQITYLLDCLDYNDGASISFQDIEKEIKETRLKKKVEQK